MRTALTAFLLCLLTAAPAAAGPWLREKGTGFASTSGTVSQSRDTSGSIYAEYGLTDKINLGLDLSLGLDRTGAADGAGVVFLRFPLGSTDGTHRFAWHAGLGGRYTGLELSPAVQFGLSWGRGVAWGERWGWATVESSVNFASAPATTRIKIDGTFGMGFTPQIKAMIQMFNTFEDGEHYAQLAPSILILPRPDSKTTFQIGFEYPVAGDGDTRLKLGLWREF